MRLLTFLILAWSALPTLVHGWWVGTHSNSILPRVNGTTDYWKQMPDDDEASAGTFVAEWDDGRIAIGNGAGFAHWVRSDIRVYVAVIEPEQPRDEEEDIVMVFLSSETYMMFDPDIQIYEQMVRDAVDPTLASRLRFFTQNQHNHHGPDTSGLGGPVNRNYFEYMLGMFRDTAVAALESRVRCTLEFGETRHNFGHEDGRDPYVIDNRVNVLRAYRKEGDSSHPYLTFVQWNMHPECTLGFTPEIDTNDCQYVKYGECTGRNAVMTGDYPGQLVRILPTLDGSENVIFFNGAIGGLTNPFGEVWEVTEEHPLGDGKHAPPGAITVPRNYRREYLIGRELAIAVANVDTSKNVVEEPTTVEFRSLGFYGRMTNFLFRIGLCPMDVVPPLNPDIPLLIGYSLRPLYICEDGVPPSDETCVHDNFEFDYDPLIIPVRVGQFARLVVHHVRLGPMQFLSIPGELLPELVVGLPQDFDTDPLKYYREPQYHEPGAAYEIPGVLYTMLNCSASAPCFWFGLTQDELGYMVPISDFHLTCIGSKEGCASDYEAGAFSFEDRMKATECDWIVADEDAARRNYTLHYGLDTARRVINTCKYGQITSTGDHYEETVSGSWQAVDEYFNAVSKLLGVEKSGRYTIDPPEPQVPYSKSPSSNRIRHSHKHPMHDLQKILFEKLFN